MDKIDESKRWWNNDLKFTLIFLALGIVMGFVSYAINVPLRSLVVSIALFIGSAVAVKKIYKLSEEKGWWFSKFIVYIFILFVVWTMLHTSCSLYNTLCL